MFLEFSMLQFTSLSSIIIVLCVFSVIFGVWLICNQRKIVEQLMWQLRQQMLVNDHLIRITTELRRATQLLAMSWDRLDKSEQQEQDAKLYVGNIDYSASKKELESLFSKYGQVDFVNIPIDHYSGKTRGFGFIAFNCTKDALRAMDLNGTTFKGRQIQVNFARERKSCV